MMSNGRDVKCDGRHKIMALESEKLSVITSVRLRVEYRISEQQLVSHNQLTTNTCHSKSDVQL
jgi:hypothetical protein